MVAVKERNEIKYVRKMFCFIVFLSFVQVWEMETGKFVYQVADAHGPSTEITAMTVDSSGYRLATGAYNG